MKMANSLSECDIIIISGNGLANRDHFKHICSSLEATLIDSDKLDLMQSVILARYALVSDNRVIIDYYCKDYFYQNIWVALAQEMKKSIGILFLSDKISYNYNRKQFDDVDVLLICDSFGNKIISEAAG